ncbi:MAG: Na/Pi cotransporter family protein [Moorea sp. SIO1F2]|uniref:Na/Pi symporter n=1 Tax=unclassified Moorena TaxID=2683338 RepID=UPI0013BBA44C|nr:MULTISPECIES: Na/Pi symporter [unclassified Moorena]NEN95222.1 Na/Pi cotransporter family protein [Moorena sp. SIO3I7]NEO05884.1 Na/Pi cotransporter family protein [Moorena sp. SIO3I8]NEO18437.1 Na/Pi cotransporter family protein [Moorena sp. SIO4A5]NEP21866.1 Na/Pi cotransporter family protein [Moorena sp. SIO3I6]NEQ58498.1 Na/Pi cotransporter family protein [Moorena sp. SIO4A1]
MSNISEQPIERSQPANQTNNILEWIKVVLLVYLLIVAVGMIGTGFKSATGSQAKELFAFATNPFLGLIVGTVATALIQSSSTVTSIIVGLVAGGLPVTTAVPMVMGANIGTSITNTLVSLGHIGDKKEFKRAFAAATIHDFFNLLSVVIFLPVEIIFHPLEKIAHFLAQNLVGGGSLSVKDLNFVKAATKPVVSVFKTITHVLPGPFDGIALIILGIAMIFLTISFIGKLLKVLMVGRAKDILHTAIGKGPIAGIAAGTLMTVLVQSSSTTTSLMVPLAGAGVFGLAQIYPFTLGANIGTCITALLAATAVSGAEAVPALEIAMVHLIYNVLGVVIIYGIPFLCRLPIISAETLAAVASERKAIAFAYIIGVFFVIPGILLGATAIF